MFDLWKQKSLKKILKNVNMNIQWTLFPKIKAENNPRQVDVIKINKSINPLTRQRYKTVQKFTYLVFMISSDTKMECQNDFWLSEMHVQELSFSFLFLLKGGKSEIVGMGENYENPSFNDIDICKQSQIKSAIILTLYLYCK